MSPSPRESCVGKYCRLTLLSPPQKKNCSDDFSRADIVGTTKVVTTILDFHCFQRRPRAIDWSGSPHLQCPQIRRFPCKIVIQVGQHTTCIYCRACCP